MSSNIYDSVIIYILTADIIICGVLKPNFSSHKHWV